MDALDERTVQAVGVSIPPPSQTVFDSGATINYTTESALTGIIGLVLPVAIIKVFVEGCKRYRVWRECTAPASPEFNPAGINVHFPRRLRLNVYLQKGLGGYIDAITSAGEELNAAAAFFLREKVVGLRMPRLQRRRELARMLASITEVAFHLDCSFLHSLGEHRL